MKIDLIIYGAAQLVTCYSNGRSKRGEQMRDVGVINYGALAINEGVIVGVGKTEEIFEQFDAENVIDAKGKVVSPAFVDPHTHVVFAGNRLNEFELKIKGADYLEILKNGGGIISTVTQTRAADLAKLIETAKLRLDKMLAHGTGTTEIKTGYGLDTKTELKMLDAIAELDKTHPLDIVPTFLPAHTFPPEYKNEEEKYVNLICTDMLPKAMKRFVASRASHPATLYSRNFFADVFCEKNAFSLDQSRRVLETAKNLGFKLKAHVDEFTNLGGARLAMSLGATSIDHLDAISVDEIKMLANSETVGVITPTVNFNFGAKEFADARQMIDAGCAIALSTDYNPGSAPCPSQSMAMAIACRYQKLLPSEALNAVTVNAAQAIESGAFVGSLETGKQADVLILDTDDYRALAYEFGGNLVETVVKKGKIVVN